MSFKFQTESSFFAMFLTIRQFLSPIGVLGVLSPIALIGGVIAYFSLGSSGDLGYSDTPNPPMEVEVIESSLTENCQLPRRFTGVLKANRSSQLGFKIDGRIKKIFVDEGDKVVQGQTLASLDVTKLQANLSELNARLDSARARLKELSAGPRSETIASARARVSDWTARVALAQENFERVERLWNLKSISKQEFDQARFDLQSKTGQLNSEQNILDELVKGTRQEKIDAQSGIVKQLQASIASLDVDVAESHIVAPFNGTISVRNFDENKIISGQSIVFELIETDHIEAWIGLTPEIAKRIANSPNSNLAKNDSISDSTSDSISQDPQTSEQKNVNRSTVSNSYQITVREARLEATLKTVLPLLDPKTRTRTAIFQLVDSHSVVPGQLARIELMEKSTHSGYWVPTNALTRGKRGLWGIMIAKQVDGKTIAVRRDVSVLVIDSGYMLVDGMIDPGEKLIVGGLHKLAPGQQVTVVNQKRSSAPQYTEQESAETGTVKR